MIERHHAVLLVLDEDRQVCRKLEEEFANSHIRVVGVRCADLDDVELLAWNPAIVVINADGETGIELCRSIWSRMSVPILITCPDPTERLKLQGFAAGARDVMSSASSATLLAAWVWSHEMRDELAGSHLREDDVKSHLGLSVNEVTREVTYLGVPVALTRIEFEILAQLIEDPEKVFHRNEIIQHVWKSDWIGDTHMLESHVSRMRKKVAVCGGPPVAVAVRGVGYRLCDLPVRETASADAPLPNA